MNETLLGCPHCGKPVGYAAAMAGKVVACPHCRGQFQMPDKPPTGPPSSRSNRPPRVEDVGVTFDEESSATDRGPAVRAELGSYRAAATLATVAAIAGSVILLIGAGLAVATVIVPQWKGDSGGLSPFQALLWMVVLFAFAFLGIAGLFLVRACVLVGLDAARTLRALERDAAASPKTK